MIVVHRVHFLCLVGIAPSRNGVRTVVGRPEPVMCLKLSVLGTLIFLHYFGVGVACLRCNCEAAVALRLPPER